MQASRLLRRAHDAAPAALVGQFICRACRYAQPERAPSCPQCDGRGALVEIRAWAEWVETRAWLLSDEASTLLNVSAQTLVEYERLGVLHSLYIAFDNALVPAYDPKEIGRLPRYDRSSHKAADGSFAPSRDDASCVVPGVITQLEFRVRYGYTCRREPCVYCRHIHSRGVGRTCKNGEDGGTSYHVRRFDGTNVAIELSAKKAWEQAQRSEQSRLAPILIARDAIAEECFDAAREIADQLDSDLGIPLLREIARAIEDQQTYALEAL